MSELAPEDEQKPLDAAAASVVAKVRGLMLISGLTTFIAIAAVTGVIGYRVFHEPGSVANPDVTALLPKGARVVSIAATADRMVVTIEVSGTLEARLFDAKTLAPAGRLRFATEP
jgi:hypothetical protein